MFSVEKMDFDLKELSTTLIKQRIHIFKVKNIHVLKTEVFVISKRML